MTNHWVDIKNANLVVVMGGNAAEAHPVGFRWAMEAKIHNGAKLIVIDPRFTRTAAVADYYAPIRSGTDIAFLSGVLLYLLNNEKFNREYTEAYTNASLIVREDYGFEDGLFTGYDAEKRKYDKSSWTYELDENGFAKRDTTLQHPRCVWNLLKQHVSRYAPDVVENICGTPKDAFLKVCEYIAETSAHDKTASFLYALGWTQHSVGAQNIRTMAMIQLLLGNMGMAGGGVNALRGHSNIQGLTDLGLLSQSLPGYMTLPSEKQTDLQTYLTANTPKPLLEGQVNYWGNYPKFFVSMMKAFFGDKATAENSWGFDWLPKWDKGYDVLQYFEMMKEGKVNGYICQGFNPVASFPNKNKVIGCLSKLKFLVTIDPLNTETSNFWQNHGELNEVDSSKIQTEVFRLPSTCFAEENGSIVNSGRWLQWHWKGADAPGIALTDGEILSGIFLRLRKMYAEQGGANPDQVLNMTWNYAIPHEPSSEEVAMESNGKALADITDPATGAVIVKKGTKWTGWDIPDYSAAPPGSGVGPFIMQQEGMGRLFALDKMAEGPFPEHYEPFETPLGTNPLHPNVISNPAARIFKDDAEALGKADKFPYVGTTYRLTEHFHYWTKHALLNAILQPEQFVEIGESLANKLGIAQGDTVKVSSNRGYIKAKAVVTKRIRTLKANGKDIDTIGIPIHWGYEGVAKKGFIANTLTPFVGDANTQTPEFKSFLVNVEKV